LLSATNTVKSASYLLSHENIFWEKELKEIERNIKRIGR